MLTEWEWLPQAVWLAPIVAIGLLLIMGMARSERRRQLDEFNVRSEVIDECFAKGDMTREECERGCTSQGDCHALSSSAASRPDSHPGSIKEE